jgi:LacI family transcriptional regulator
MGHSVAVSFISKGAYEQDGFHSWVELENLMYSDGLFIPPAIPDSLEVQLLQLPLPKVMINYPPPLAAVDSVIWDVIGAIHQAVEHFVSMGHRRILYIGDIYKFRGFQLRWQAFEEAMKWHGSVMVPEEHLTSSYSHSELWMSELKEKLSQGHFTAILCAVDHDLAKIFYVVHSLQLSIPDDISLISLADMENPLFPQVTRPLLLVKEGGQRAAERLLWRIANPNLPYEHIRLQGGFYNGSTVKRIT